MSQTAGILLALAFGGMLGVLAIVLTTLLVDHDVPALIGVPFIWLVVVGIAVGSALIVT